MRKNYKFKQITLLTVSIFLFSIFLIPITAHAAVTSYISDEASGNNQLGRDVADTLDDNWMTTVSSIYSCNSTNSTSINRAAITSPIDTANLITSNGVTVSVSLQNVTDAKVGVANGTNFSVMASTVTLQDSSPMPSSIVSSGYYANETGGSNSSRNGALFTFSSPVRAFGAWFGDLESRTTDVYGSVRAYVRYFDENMNQIGIDTEVINTTDESQCGSIDSTNAAVGCGNRTTRWIGFVADASTPVKYMLVVVGDDDTTNPSSAYEVADINSTNGNTESISFVGPTLVTNNGCSSSSSSISSSNSSSLSTSANSSISSITSSVVSSSMSSSLSASSTSTLSSTLSSTSSLTSSISSSASSSLVSSSNSTLTSSASSTNSSITSTVSTTTSLPALIGDITNITNINNGTINNTTINGDVNNTVNNYGCGCNTANCSSTSSNCSCNSASSSANSTNITNSSMSSSSSSSSQTTNTSQVTTSSVSSVVTSSTKSSSLMSSSTSNTTNSLSSSSSSSSQGCTTSSGCGSTVTNITYNINYGNINYTVINGGVNNTYNYFGCGGICSSSSSNSTQTSVASQTATSVNTSNSTATTSSVQSLSSLSLSSSIASSSSNTITSNNTSSIVSSATSSGSVLGTETMSSSSSVAPVCLSTNLHLVKYHSGNFTVGQNNNFTLSVSNYGPNVAKAPLTINDTLPVGMQLVSYSGSNWNCSSVGQNVTCVRNIDMTANENSQIIMTVSVSNQTLSRSTNVASVYFACGEMDPVDNTASDTVTTQNPSVLGVTDNGLAKTGANYLAFLLPGLSLIGSTLLFIKTKK